MKLVATLYRYIWRTKRTDEYEGILKGINKSYPETPANLGKDLLLEHITVNVFGPALIAQSFIEESLIQPGALVLNMTSGLSSVELTIKNHTPDNLSYSISKAGVNMLTAKQSKQWKDIAFISVDPGWVQTDMGGPKAHLTVEESVNGLINEVIHKKGLKDTGAAFVYTGESIPF